MFQVGFIIHFLLDKFVMDIVILRAKKMDINFQKLDNSILFKMDSIFFDGNTIQKFLLDSISWQDNIILFFSKKWIV